MVQIKAPNMYYNEYRLLERSGKLIAALGKHFFIIAGRRAFNSVKDTLIPALEAEKLHWDLVWYGGKTTKEEISALSEKATASRASALIAIGGGKIMDASKAAAEDAGLPVITIPTIASNCSAYTSLSVVYDESGGHKAYRRLKKAPDLILADTGLLRLAPKRFLAAGMGDTLAKWLEAYNFFDGGYASINERLGAFIARQAWDLIFTHFHEAYTQAESLATGIHSPDTPVPGKNPAGTSVDIFTDVIDAIFFLSGLIGSIRGGKHVTAYIHPLNDAFTRLPEGQSRIHGEVVSFANIVQMVLFRQDEAIIQKLLTFNKTLGLPLSLDDLGFAGQDPRVSAHRLSSVFDWEESVHDTTTPFQVRPDDLEVAILTSHALGLNLTH
jgi:glycerol dehydrogenase